MKENAIPKIFLATIHYKNSPFEFASSLASVVRQMTIDGIFSYSYAVGSAEIDRNRNECVERFLQTDATHLLFLDDDMQFPPDVAKLLLRHKKPIVSGLYFQRTATNARPHLYRYDGLEINKYGEEEHKFLPLTTQIWELLKDVPHVNKPMFIDKKELVFPIDMGGNGCLLIERDVFNRIPYPWFRSVGGNNGDVVFFKNCMDAGIEMIGDAGIVCLHQALIWFGLESFYEVYDKSLTSRDNAIRHWNNWYDTNKLVTPSYQGIDRVLKGLMDHVGKKGKYSVVDYGCGVNDVHRILAKDTDISLTGIDFSISAIMANREKYPDHKWINADILHPIDGIGEYQFDMALCLDVISGIMQPERVLDLAWRTIKKGGIMVVGVTGDWNDIIKLSKRYNPSLYTFPLPDINIIAIQKAV